MILIRNIGVKFINFIFTFFYILFVGITKSPIPYIFGIIAIFLFFNISDSFLTSVGNITFKEFKNNIQDSEYIVILSEFLLGFYIYLYFIKITVQDHKKKNTIKNLIDRELKNITEKLKNYNVELSLNNKIRNKFLKSIYKISYSKIDFHDYQYEFLDMFKRIILESNGFTEGKSLFIQYILLPLYDNARKQFFDNLLYKPISLNSPKNEFLSLCLKASNARSKKNILHQKTQFIKDEKKSKEIFEKISNYDIESLKLRQSNKFDREALITIAENTIKNGYSTLDEIISFKKGKEPYKLLIKYDERFRYFKDDLKKMALKKYENEEAEKTCEEAMKYLSPYPLAYALKQFEESVIKLLPKDHFLYVFNLEFIKSNYNIEFPEIFMEKKIIRKARQYQNRQIKKIINFDECFKGLKKSLNANYYIIDIDIDSMLISADKEAIPEGIEKLIIRDIVDNGDINGLVSSQIIYHREIIERMPLDAFLFGSNVNEPFIAFLKKNRKTIADRFKKHKIPFATIADKMNFNNYITNISIIIQEIIDKENEGMKFSSSEIKKAFRLICSNAKKLNDIIVNGI